MKKKFSYFYLFIACLGLMLSSCNKDEVYLNSTASNQTSGESSPSKVTDIDIFDSVKSIATFNSKKTLSKSYYGLDKDCYELGTATYVDDTTITYLTMKVYRKSDNSKYFYVMLTNLDIPDVAVSHSYANDSSNDALYGRLYNRDGADMYANKVKMKLQTYVNGVPSITRNVFGKLISQEDLNDILEIDSYNSNSVYDLVGLCDWADYFYYDAFVFGLGDDASESAAFHTLAGWKNSYSIYDPMFNYTPEQLHQLEIVYQAGYYSQKNHKGSYWMRNVDLVTDASDVLIISRHNYWNDDDDWKVGIGTFANHSYDFYEFSVRYVFDPFIYR